jgi:hypothetical protein
MFTEIITNKAVMVDAMKPTELNKILFKDFITVTNTDNQSEMFQMNIYKVVVEATEEVEGEYQLLKNSARDLDKATLDALVASLTITSTTYTDIRNEQIVKGLAKVIVTEAIFGLTEADLIIR